MAINFWDKLLGMPATTPPSRQRRMDQAQPLPLAGMGPPITITNNTASPQPVDPQLLQQLRLISTQQQMAQQQQAQALGQLGGCGLYNPSQYGGWGYATPHQISVGIGTVIVAVSGDTVEITFRLLALQTYEPSEVVIYKGPIDITNATVVEFLAAAARNAILADTLDEDAA